ncbi:MAG: hypothetical protein KME21_28455 [Desmonostoc vinosum HA7617-LM4]|jgi:lactobin A/cerein 7B family class IIb bacteriocin|nr:hypothetical protein [Desmonostoc vinosum HA7617-LM4]
MATICIQDLRAGFDLISDEETYLNEFTDEEFAAVKGGIIPIIITTIVAFSASAGASYAITRIFR